MLALTLRRKQDPVDDPFAVGAYLVDLIIQVASRLKSLLTHFPHRGDHRCQIFIAQSIQEVLGAGLRSATLRRDLPRRGVALRGCISKSIFGYR
jgi:hypothetical protein